MSKSSRTPLAALLLAATAPQVAGCVTHDTVTELSGVNGIRGVPSEYQVTRSYAIHGLFAFPLLGNATRERTLREFAQEASANGATRMRITGTTTKDYWFLAFPLSLLFTPVVTIVEGDVEQETDL